MYKAVSLHWTFKEHAATSLVKQLTIFYYKVGRYSNTPVHTHSLVHGDSHESVVMETSVIGDEVGVAYSTPNAQLAVEVLFQATLLEHLQRLKLLTLFLPHHLHITETPTAKSLQIRVTQEILIYTVTTPTTQ